MINKIAMCMALVLGGIAVLIARSHVAAVRSREEAVSLVVVTKDLEAGATPGRALEEYTLPEEFASGVATAVHGGEVGLIAQSKLVTGVKKGSFLLWSHFGGSGRESDRALLDVVEPGKRAIALPMSWMEAVGGHVRPGDYVDILATFTVADRDGKAQTQAVTLEQRLKVLATEGQTSYAQGVISGRMNRNQYQSIVFEVDPLQAEMLAFTQVAGKALTLVLRRHDDLQRQEIPRMNWLNYSQAGGADLPQDR